MSEEDRVAIVGMAGRFPGAADVAQMWDLSVAGRSGLTDLGRHRPGHVPVRGVLQDADRFDAEYFGIPEREARVLDPQQRVLLEVAQHAFDDAEIDHARAGNVAVYAACAPHPPPAAAASFSERYELDLAGQAGFAAMRLAYRLGLRGEAITVETACSSSLVAVHLACQSLLSGQSDIALAGGVSIPPSQDEGYPVEDGMITSPTGRCCPFEAGADGTVPGAGAGLVVLKRLVDAADDEDRIWAVIAGTAINNDGATKIGFMAPSPEGQAEVIATAHAVAGVAAGSIGYVETHGTATRLGDAVEIEGLRKSFGLDPARIAPCALGSLKANCGHLDRAAGVAGLIRAALALRSRTIPPMAGFVRPDPDLGLAEAGFTVPTHAEPWPAGPEPRRAGVSGFGVGGTNAHAVLEEPPERPARDATEVPGPHLLALTGHTPRAVARAASQLADLLGSDPRLGLPAVAATLATGRRVREFRSFVVAATAAEAAAELREPPAAVRGDRSPAVVFAFPGHGASHVDGLPELYRSEPVFRDALDRHADTLAGYIGADIRSDLYGDPAARETVFGDTRRFQPAMVAVELALTELWASWGLVPDAVLGHSLGEIPAAVCTGVFTREQALALVARRAAVMYQTRPGANLSVGMPAAELRELLPDGVHISAVNGAELTTVAGHPPAVERLAERLAQDGTFVRRLPLNFAPHGAAMREAAQRLGEFASSMEFSAPRVPMLSNITGDWADERIGTPGYWSDHLVSVVRFADQLGRLTEMGSPLVIEMGPGHGLTRMIAHEIGAHTCAVIPSTGEPGREPRHRAAVLRAAGHAWSLGADVDLTRLVPAAPRVALPPTSFDHSRRWPREHHPATVPGAVPAAPARHTDPGAWLYEPRLIPLDPAARAGAGQPAPDQLACTDGPAADARLAWTGGGTALRAAVTAEAERLIGYQDLPPRSGPPADVLWWVGDTGPDLLARAWAIAERLSGRDPGSRVWLLAPSPDPALIGSGPGPADLALAAARVLPQELPGPGWHLVTVDGEGPAVARNLLALLADPAAPPVTHVDAEGVARLAFEHAWPAWTARPLHDRGCYVITGGAGPVGRALAVALAREVRAEIVVTGRRPARDVGAELNALASTVGSLGSSLSYRSVDVTRRAETMELFAALRRRHGRIAGVIHAAGLTDRDQFRISRDATPAEVMAVSAAKVTGCANIAAALTGDDADFVLLCSSLSVVLGGVRFGPYIAANASLEEFARQRHRAGDTRWIAVGWDAWGDPPAGQQAGPGRYALSPQDGHEIFRRLLSVRGPVVYTSTAELADRIAEVSAELTGPAQAEAPDDHGTPEETVHAVLRETLGGVPQDRDRDLRSDGIESLTVLQIVTRLRETLGVKIPLGEAFGALTVAGLEDLARRSVAAQPATATPDADRPDADGPDASGLHPTTAIQQRWLDLLDEGYGGIDLAVEVLGAVPAARLAAAVTQVIERHSGLRTTFRRAERTWLQQVVPALPVPVVDLSGRGAQDQAAELSALAASKAGTWYDVAASPPFEVTVAALGPEQNALLIHAHHVVFDGWSSSIFLRDIGRALRGELTGRAPQYVEHVRSHLAYLGGADAEAARDHWRRHFRGAQPPTRIPPDVDVEDRSDRGAHLDLRLGGAVSAALRDRAAAEGTTVFALMMCVFGLLLHRLTGEEDLIVGTTAAGRPTVASEETVGVFVSPLPLRLRLDPGETVRRFLARTHTTLVGFHEHGGLPLTEFVRGIAPFTGMGLNDTFHCYLLYQNYWRPTAGEVEYRPLRLAADVHHKLMREFEIVAEDGSDGISAELWYRPSRFSAASAASWAALYTELLAQIALDRGALGISTSALIARCATNETTPSQAA